MQVRDLEHPIRGHIDCGWFGGVTNLQSIPEAPVLKLCKIVHSSFNRRLLLFFAESTLSSSLLISPLVARPHVHVQDHDHAKLDGVANKHGNVSRVIVRRLARLERLWTDDVACECSSQQVAA